MELTDRQIYLKSYRQRSYVKERGKLYRSRPEVKIQRKKYLDEYRKSGKAKIASLKHKKSGNWYKGWLRTRYGITVEQVNDTLLRQNKSCAICKTSDQKLVVDHCHNTNKFRGMLCNNCNLGLGKFKDNDQFLTIAAMYIKGNN